jgi:hypothetical protein
MMFRIFELYQQGRELRRNPVGFGAGLGRDAVAPMFVIPVILLAVGSLGALTLWWRVGWGVFLFVSIILAIGIIVIHLLYFFVSKLFGRVESVAQDSYSGVQEQLRQRGGAIIDTTSHESYDGSAD